LINKARPLLEVSGIEDTKIISYTGGEWTTPSGGSYNIVIFYFQDK